MADVLKPCPFCGGEAILSNNVGMSYVRCKSCGAVAETVRVSAEYSSNEKAIEAWNRRAEPKGDD